MNLLKLLNPSYLFDPTPGYSFGLFWPTTLFFVIIFALSFQASKMLSKFPHEKHVKAALFGIPARMREFAFLGLILTFFREQGIPWIGMRALIVFWVLGGLLYTVYRFKVYKKALKEGGITKKTKREVDPYLPVSKRKAKKKR